MLFLAKKIEKELTDEEVRDRLCLNNPYLVSQIMLHATKIFDDTNLNRKDLDEKANWFLTLTSACLILFFTGISVLFVQEPNNIPYHKIFFIISLICIVSLCVSTFFFFLAICARSDFKAINECDVLDVDVLNETEPINNDSEEYSSVIYDRFMIANLLKISKTNACINTKKGSRIIVGQITFLCGFILLSVITIILCYKLSNTGGNMADKPAPTKPSSGGTTVIKSAPKPIIPSNKGK